jgi:hypothetical protein
MTALKLRSVLAAAVLGLAVLFVPGRQGGALALEFQCIEASRYKFLLRIFVDDPANFSSYFSLPREPRPPPEVCRALLLTGTLAPGDTRKLLQRVIESKGWLAVLYLSHAGTAPDEEAKLALAIRALWLKTRFSGAKPARYEPDFVAPTRSPGPSAMNAWPAVPQPGAQSIKRALNDYYQVNKVVLPLEPDKNWCRDSCVGIFLAGVQRRSSWTLGTDPQAGGTALGDDPESRRRAVLQRYLDVGQTVAANDPAPAPASIMKTSITPGFVVQTLRAKCSTDIDAATGLQDQIRSTVEDLSKRNFDRFMRLDNLMPRFESLGRVTLRLERCLAGTYERERLAKFKERCSPSCEIDRLDAEFEKSAREFFEKTK